MSLKRRKTAMQNFPRYVTEGRPESVPNTPMSPPNPMLEEKPSIGCNLSRKPIFDRNQLITESFTKYFSSFLQSKLKLFLNTCPRIPPS